MSFLRYLPMGLVFLRLLLAPLIVVIAHSVGPSAGPWLAALVVLGVLSDIFDGIIARRLGVATPGLRRLDSQADLVFWMAVLWAACLLQGDLLLAHWWQLALLLGLEGLIYLIAFARFGKEMSSHAWSAKLWGLALTLAFARLLAIGATCWSFELMFWLGLLCQLDVIAIALLLPTWKNDVPSAWHAWQLRQGKSFRTHRLFN